ncbi:isochorismatase family [Fusarium longipes]|uniref:Isochorismatase family n=1 Tax=Fusarium longipes TaxID=694270 RepID=A0A395T2R7_9HYPO|nr:isochorismatase family [Fusarium longipes]
MFSFDQASLPQITTRKALIGVDFQDDFISKDGALPVHEPEGFVERTIKLSEAFRNVGDVVWVQSQFSETRHAPEEDIVITDKAPKSIQTSSRSRPTPSDKILEAGGPPDKEAFLSHEDAICVKTDTPGCQIASAIQGSMQNADTKLFKSHYSAFQSTHLLRVLRAKMVMELFICGSLTNVGVYATALDAAGHGMAITIVDDCCGYRSESRKSAAIASLIELTGCEIASYDEVMEAIQPKRKPHKSRDAKPPASPTGPEQPQTVKSGPKEANDRDKSTTPDFVKDMTTLRLASDPPNPARPSIRSPSKDLSTGALEDDNSSTKLPPKVKEPDEVNQRAKNERPGIAHVDDLSTKGDNAGVAEVKADQKTLLQSTSEASIVNSYHSKGSSKEKDQGTESSSSASRTEGKSEHIQTTTLLNDKQDEELFKESDEPLDQTQALQKDTTTIASQDNNLRQRGLCEGDTDIIENALPDSLVEGIFDKLREEVQWQRMSHQGGQVPRLVAVQGEIGPDGSMPVYRHPSDESPPLLPFSPTVQAIRVETEKHLGHPLNHVLVQYYRDGTDYISEHSDKTLDIVKGSYIANMSLGAERTFTFRTKRKDKDLAQDGASLPTELKRTIQRAQLPHNSLCRLGLRSNMKWLHAIRPDKRPKKEKSEAELAFNGGRISLTFRHIGTFLNREETLIWGQGAKAKTRDKSHPVVNGQSSEAIEMLKAFGMENHAAEFDWDAHYGKGFDVLHMSNAPRFFFCHDPIVNLRVTLMLAEFGVNYAKGSITTGSESPSSDKLVVKFADKDDSVVQGDLAVMLYLDARYGIGKPGSNPQDPRELATRLTRFQRAMGLLDTWQNMSKLDENGKREHKSLRQELQIWDGFVEENAHQFIAGTEMSLPDFAIWPVLHSIVEELGRRPSTKKVLGRD